MRAQLDSGGINFEFTAGVDGAAGEHKIFENYDDSYCEKMWRRPLTVGEVGCFASHYVQWRRCIETERPLIVMEDDVRVSANFGEILDILRRIDGLEFVRLSAATEPSKIAIASTIPSPWSLVRFLDSPLGTQCYAVFPAGARKLVAAAQRWTMPVDHFIDSSWVHGVPCVGIMPFVADHDRRLASTISPEGKSPSSIMRNRVWRPKRFAARIYGDVRRGLENVQYRLGLRELPKIALHSTCVCEV